VASRFTFSRGLYRLLLRTLPASFRRRFGADMEEDFAELMASSTGGRPIAGRVRGWRLAVADLARTSSRERGRAAFGAIRLDLKDATRRLARSPLFTISVVGTLGVGLAVVILTYAIVDGVWLRPLPYADPDRLVTSTLTWSVGDYLAVAREQDVFADVAGYSLSYPPLVLLGDESRVLKQALVTPNFLQVLGVQPVLGVPRLEDGTDGEPGVVLPYSLWVQGFGGDPAIIGRGLQFEDHTRRVIAVLGPDFVFPASIQPLAPDVLTVLPLSSSATGRWLRAIGRLRPAASLTLAAATVNRVAPPPPPSPGGPLERWRVEGTPPVRPIADSMVGTTRTMMALLIGSVGFLLLIASANLMHMLIARGTARAREIGVRRALGARRSQLVRLVLIESLLLVSAGGLVGWALSIWSIDAVRALVPSTLPRAAFIMLNGRVFAGAAAFTIGLGLLSGMLPAIHLSRPGAEDLLQRGGRGGTSSRARLGRLLIAIETALAVVLVAGAGLMLNSLIRLAGADTGFSSAGVLQINVRVPASLTDHAGHEFVDRVRDRLQTLPFVRATAVSDAQPIFAGTRLGDLLGEGSSAGKVDSDWRAVSPDYFRTLGIRLIEGREFASGDRTHAPEAAILSQSVARTLWPSHSAIGQRFRALDLRRDCEVIGVVADVRSFRLRTGPTKMVYLSADRERAGNLYVSVRVDDPRRLTELAAPISRAVRSVDARAPVSSVRPLEDLVSDSLAETRMEATLLGVFGVLALGVAMAGVAGVTAYSVTQRTRELGIRLALGLAPARLARLVIAESLLPAVIGTAAGIAAALALATALASLVYGISARDPATFAGVAGGLLLATTVASYLPARRASRLDPTIALRAE
jgi:predicted permease